MPQPRRGGSSSGSGGRSTSGGGRSSSGGGRSSSGGRRSTSARSTRSSSQRSSRSTTSRGQRAGAGGRSSAAQAAAGGGEAQLDAAAQRIRRLNERIITAGRDAGETTLQNYEKALKAIASAVERGPGSSDVEWISHLANAQAKFIRDVTTAWTSAARNMIK